MKPSTIFPAITFIVLIGTFGLSVFEIHEVSEIEIEFLIILVGTFGMGGLYKEAIRSGFAKFQEIKKEKEVKLS